MATESTDNIIYLQTRPQDIESLITLIPRAFHPVNPFMKGMFPDTPLMRDWWRSVFSEYEGSNPACHLPIALDITTNTVIGGLVFRMVEPYGDGCGFVGKHPPTTDHNLDIWPLAVKGFAEDQKQTVGERGRFLIEVMGVDHAWQGKGIGKRLVEMACEIADGQGYPIFLETTQAKEFYLKLGMGFEVVAKSEHAKNLENAGTMVREPWGGGGAGGVAR